MKTMNHFPVRAIPCDTVRVNLPSVGGAGDAASQRARAVDDLLAHTFSRYNTYFLPLLCRYRLYDRNGRIVFTSKRVRLGAPVPQIRFVCRSRVGLLSLCAWIDYEPWHLRIDDSRLVPQRLRHIAARAEVLLMTDHPLRLRRKEFVVRSVDLSPSETPLLLPVKTESDRIRKKAKRLCAAVRRLPRRLIYSRKNRIFAPDMQCDRRNTDLKSVVRDAVTRHSLIEPGDRLIVALSGGADSVALLAVLTELGYDCVAAHCNFHLRGDESMRDMRHAEAVCRRLGVDLVIRDFDVGKRRAETGESVEMACRSLRYEWFDELLERQQARAIVVGHHSEDNVETLLLNLLRGTGIDGLCGMRYRRGFVLRPMLDATRADIEAYLADRGLTFVNDSSNSSDAHLRNRLRNNVIPEMQRNFPGAGRAILASAANLAAAASIYHRAIDSYRRRFVAPDGSVNLTALVAELGDDSRTVIFELFRDIGVTPQQCSDIVASASRSGLRFETSAGVIVELDRGVLTVSRPETVMPQSEYDVDLSRDILSPLSLRVSRHHISEFRPTRDCDVIYLDVTALDPAHRWTLRQWRKGDRMWPFGMKGSRLISDIFSDAKLSAAQKRNTWLLTCDGRVVWVVGIRASADFNVGPHTNEYLKIIYKR